MVGLDLDLVNDSLCRALEWESPAVNIIFLVFCPETGPCPLLSAPLVPNLLVLDIMKDLSPFSAFQLIPRY